MKWFKHYTSAHDNNKLTKVRMRYGAEGYAIYWYCLELIAGDLGEQESINFELKHDAEVIAFNLKVDTLKVEEVMRYMVQIGLFEEIDNIITCLKIAKYLEKKTTRNKTIHKIIDTAKQINDPNLNPAQEILSPDSSPTVPQLSPLDTDTDTEENIKHTFKPTGSNTGYLQAKVITTEQPKVEKFPFDEFWKLYPKKQSKKPTEKKWNKLSLKKRQAAMVDIKTRYQNTEKQYIPLPTKYINEERWDDEKLDFSEQNNSFFGGLYVS